MLVENECWSEHSVRPCLSRKIKQEVKVDKVGRGHLTVMVTCKKGEDLLVSIMEEFERLNVNVVQARVSCKHFFGMEAIVEDTVDAAVLSDAILKVIQNPSTS